MKGINELKNKSMSDEMQEIETIPEKQGELSDEELSDVNGGIKLKSVTKIKYREKIPTLLA